MTGIVCENNMSYHQADGSEQQPNLIRGFAQKDSFLAAVSKKTRANSKLGLTGGMI